jgi:ribosomal protein L36
MYVKFSFKTRARFGNMRLHYVGYYESMKFLGKEKTTTLQSKVVRRNGVVYDLCRPGQHQPPSNHSQVEPIENGYHVIDHTS